MLPTTPALEGYLAGVFGLPTTLRPWPPEADLPRLLTDRYAFERLGVHDQEWLVAIDREHQPLDPPAAIARQLTPVGRDAGLPVVLVSRRIAAHNRKRLIGQRQAFVVPGSQVYLPQMGMVFQEHYRPKTERPTTLAPATQALLLAALYRPALLDGTQAAMAETLGYSRMTLSRAHEELVQARLIGADGVDPTHWPQARPAAWRAALPLLRSPVRRRRHLAMDPDDALARWPAAGETALGRLTEVVGPPTPTVAMSQRQWARSRADSDGMPRETAADDPDAVVVEIWSYAPLDWGRRDIVDPLSLILSVRDDPDERLQAALEDLEATVW